MTILIIPPDLKAAQQMSDADLLCMTGSLNFHSVGQRVPTQLPLVVYVPVMSRSK